MYACVGLSIYAHYTYTHRVLPAYYDPQHKGNTVLDTYLQGQKFWLHIQSKSFGSLALYQLINSIDVMVFLDRRHIQKHYLLHTCFLKYLSRFCFLYNSPVRVNHVTSSKRGGKWHQTHHILLKLQSPLCPFLIFFHTAVQICKFGCSFLWVKRELKAINGGAK